MSLNHATLNMRGLRDSSKCSCLLGEISNLALDVGTVQETHFTYAAVCRVQDNYFVVLSVYSSRIHLSTAVYLRSITDKVDASIRTLF